MTFWTIHPPGSRLLGAAICLLAFPVAGALAEPITLAVIGDSSSSGYGLAPNEGFVDQLEVWLKDSGDPPVVIKDYAESGLTTAKALAILESELDASIDAVIIQLGDSDGSISIESGETRANLRSLLELARQNAASVLLIGTYATEHQTPAYRQELDTLFPQIAAETGAMLYPSLYHALGGRISDVPPEYLQWDQGHPTTDAVRIIVDDIGPTVLKLVAEVEATKTGN